MSNGREFIIVYGALMLIYLKLFVDTDVLESSDDNLLKQKLFTLITK